MKFFFHSKKGFKGYRIRRQGAEIEPQEILLDKLVKQRELEISERKLEVPLRKRVLQTFFIFVLILLFLIGSKTFYLQVFRGKELTLLAEKNREIRSPIRTPRGVIYDRNGAQLVFNKGVFDLICEKRDLPWEKRQRDQVLRRVSQVLEKDVENLKREIEESDLPRVLISENLDHTKLILLETEIASKKIEGFLIEKNTVRDYVEEGTLSHVLGFTGKISQEELEVFEDYSIADQIGKRGLEKFYERDLRGKQGVFKIERDAKGNIISKETLSTSEPGKSLLLHLDFELQKKIEKELSKALRESGTKRGIAIALDPKTGGVLSLISIPSFNNNLFSKKILEEEWQELKNDPEEPLFNRAISGIGYPTGSSIKPLIATAALEEKIIWPEERINCQGEIVIENPWYDPEHSELGQREWIYHDWKIHGSTDMRKAIAESCNIYFYTIGGGYKGFEGLGPEKIIKWLELFGWGEKTDIDLPEEGQGILPDIDTAWRLGHTYHLSIGQGAFSTTPLQMVTAFSSIANGGTLYKPVLAKELLDQNKNVVEKIASKILRENFVKKENLEIVREGMRQAVTSPSGSAFILNSLPVSSAAKTGTAQTSKENFYHSWVTVFAPYEDPEIVLTIMVEEVPGLQMVVSPVAREVLNWYFSLRTP